MNQKVKYLLRSVVNAGQKRECPYCGGNTFECIDSKYGVTFLLKCKNCALNHRHPKDSAAFLKRFYQSDYSIDVHMMTDLPSDQELVKLKEGNFPALRNYTPYVKALLKKSTGKLLDYGCSWGYSVFQLKAAGYDASGFEISVPRASYGAQKLELTIAVDENNISPQNDLIMTSHVIEHLSSISNFRQLLKSKLKEDGIVMIFCPNGSKEYRKREPELFHVNWGFLHPNYLDIDFAQQMFSNNPYLILTGDWEFNLSELESWDGKTQTVGGRRDGKELLIISKPNIQINSNGIY